MPMWVYIFRQRKDNKNEIRAARVAGSLIFLTFDRHFFILSRHFAEILNKVWHECNFANELNSSVGECDQFTGIALNRCFDVTY